MPDDHASSSDNPQRDETSASAGTPQAVHGEPPTLPPFAASGTRPMTLVGMPAVDVFGGADDLFANVPALGPRPASGPVPSLPVASPKLGGVTTPKVAVPVPPALAGKPAPPPKLSATGKPLGPPPQPPRSPIAKPGETPSTRVEITPQPMPVATAMAEPKPVEPKPVEPKSAPSNSDLAEAIALSPDLEYQLMVGLIDPAEVIRAAREQAASKAAEAKPAETKPVESKSAVTAKQAEPKSGILPKPVESKSAVTAKQAEPKSGILPKPVEPKSGVVPKPVEPKSGILPKPVEPTSGIFAKPLPKSESVVEAPPGLEEPKSGSAAPKALIDDRQSPPPSPQSSDPLGGDPMAADPLVAAITESSPEFDSTISIAQIMGPAIADSAIAPTLDSSAPADPPKASDPEPSQGVADTSSSVAAGTPSKPDHALAPPAPRSIVDDRPRIGVPYEPPAVLVRLPLPDPEAESASTSSPEPEEPSARGPITLPKPNRSAAPPARAPVPPADAGKVVPLPVLARPEGTPNPIGKEDTAALIDGMTKEIVEQARQARNATLIVDADEEERPAANSGRRKLIIGFELFAIAASLVVALLPGDEPEDDAVAANDSAGDPEPAPSEPSPTEPEAQPEPAGDDAAPPTEPAPGEPETEPPPSDPEPGPVAENPSSKPKSSKPKSDSKSSTKSEPTVATSTKPEPAPAPTTTKTEPAADNRDAKQLYDAAKAAYDKGKASEAYKLAAASYKKGAKPKTAELMVLAACKLGDAAKASSALAKVAGLRKPALRKQCKSMGTSI